MKRFVCLLMTLIMVLGLFPTAALATETSSQAQDLPERISADTVWSYLDDGTDPAAGTSDRTSWAAIDFDDSAWKTAKGSFGAKNGAIASLSGGYTPNTLLKQYKEDGSTNIEAFFFRTDVKVEDASAVKTIEGSLIHDDSATLYINGAKVAGWGDDGVTENLQYATNGHQDAPAAENISITDTEVLKLLKDGVNTIAVEIHQDRASSSDVYFDMPSLVFSTEVPDTSSVLLDGDARWTYLDNNTDPAGGSGDRTSWTAIDFDDSAWETAVGPFGSKKGNANLETGYTAATVLDGCNGSNDTPAYFFRTTFTIGSLDGVTQLVGTLQHDDGVIVYINGHRVAAFDDVACNESGESLGTAITENLQYGGANGGTPKTNTFAVTDLSILKEGENTIAVELHQGRQTSSDIWFHLTELALSDEEVVVPPAQTDISLSMGADETQMNFTWYYADPEAGKVLVAKESDLKDGQMPTAADKVEVFQATSTASNDAGYYSNQATVTGLEAGATYAYQLVNGEDTSDIYTFTTDDGGAFSFAYVGDPQIGASGNATSDTSGWDETLNIIDTNSNFSDISFMLSAGDQVNTATSESEYDGYLNHDALTSLPVATVIGNHDTSSNAYGQHFNVANESGKYGTTNAGGDSYFVYNNVLFMVLNTNNLSTAEHKAFMEAAIEATKNQDIRWKIVTFHQSIYTVASHYHNDNTQRREELAPVFDSLGIDVVLQGHDHVYCRTYMMDGLEVSKNENYTYGNGEDKAPTAVTDPTGILYVTANSGSGSKHYDIKTNVEFPYSAVQNQEKVPNVSKVTVSDTQFTITTYRTTDMTVVDTFTINRTTGTEPIEPSVTINTASATGLVEYLSSYSTGNTNADGGVAEIVKFNEENDCMYLVSGQTQTLDIVKVKEDGSTELVKKIDIAALGSANDFSAGDITSVDVNTDRDLVVIAVQHADYTKNGAIVLLDYEGSFVAKYETGVQPDMVTFTPDGSKILTANEGEPREGYEATDPMGSVTVVDLDAKVVNTYDFESLDSSRDALINHGVLLRADTDPSVDLEPEFIAVSEDNKTAYVTLQENNAIAALNLTTGTWKYVKGLGFKDYSAEGNGLDLDVDGKIDIRNENVYGVYMPDGISVVTIGGQDYLITANEGDAREWGDYENIDSDKLILADGQEAGKKIEYLDTSKTDGLESGKTYVLGGRSFSIWKADTLEQVFDSGDDFETITAEEFPAYFNSGHDEAGLDKRSHKKGVEPESVSVLETNGKTYAVIGLERMGGIMVYDITNPAKATYADYLNVRGFSETVTDLSKLGDLGPEGICAISAENSPTGNAMILVANEVSGTVTVAQIEKTSTSGGSSSGGGSSSSSYAVTLNQGDNGTVTASSKTAAKGSTVTLTVKADSGYELNALTVTDKNGSEVTLTKKSDGVYTFTMPASKVTVSASFVEDGDHTGGLPFTDVKSGDWFYDGVDFVYEEGIMNGLSDTTFGPHLSTTRGMVVTMLWRMENEPQAKTGAAFADVKESAYYAEAIDWAAENGIVNGTSETTFAPDQVVTREQLSAILYRYSQVKGYDTTAQGDLTSFGDWERVSSYAVAPMKWAVGASLIQGMDDNLVPAGSATRAQLATIFQRFITNIAS